MKERNEKRPARKKGIVPIVVLLTIGLVVNIACGIFYSAITPFMTANLNPLLTGQKQVTTGQSQRVPPSTCSATAPWTPSTAAAAPVQVIPPPTLTWSRV